MTFRHAFFEDYFDRLADLHQQMTETVKGLPPEALNWVPGPDMNSIAVLVTHTCGAERFWIETMAGGADSDRMRAEEFEVEATDEAALLTLIDRTLADSRLMLESFKMTILDESRYGAQWGRDFRHGWSLLHALEHAATHVGHMQITRQLWEQQ